MDLRIFKVTIVNAKKKGKDNPSSSHDFHQFPPGRKADERESRLQITQQLVMKGVFRLRLKTATIRDKIFSLTGGNCCIPCAFPRTLRKHIQKWELNRAKPFHTLPSVYFVYIMSRLVWVFCLVLPCAVVIKILAGAVR